MLSLKSGHFSKLVLLPRRSSWVPSLSTDKITVASGPGDGVRASISVGISGLGSVVRPPGVVETVVCSSSAWGSTTSQKFETSSRVCWGGEDASNCGNCNEERGEGDHFDDFGQRGAVNLRLANNVLLLYICPHKQKHRPDVDSLLPKFTLYLIRNRSTEVSLVPREIYKRLSPCQARG